MKNSNYQKWLMVILLAIGGGTIFKSLYLREMLYYPWNEFMGVDNTQSGLLMSWLGLVGVLAGAAAGVIVDKINNTRLVIAGTFVVMGLATLWQSTAPSLATQYVIIAILSFFANGFFLVSMVRATRLIGDSESQGKMFGFLESGRGIFGSIVSAGAIVIVAKSATDIEGVANILHAYGLLYIALGVMMWFCLPKTEKETTENGKSEKVDFQQIKALMKIKEVWLAAFAVFATIAFYQGSSYLVPYLTDAYGMSTDQAGIVGMVRAYVLAIFLAPVAGILVDKVGSAIKVMQVLFMVGAVCTGLFLIIPQKPEVVLFMIAALLVAGSINFALRGVMYAQIEELKVPKHLTGTVSGIVITIGFSPEIFIHALFGYWLDTYQLTGYNYMFMFMTALFAIAVLTSGYLCKNGKDAFASKLDSVEG